MANAIMVPSGDQAGSWIKEHEAGEHSITCRRPLPSGLIV
jgi:hypothetical protein